MATITNKSFFAILLLLISCTHQQKDNNSKGYEIMAQIKNIRAHRVYLNTMVLDSAGQPKWPVIDSADYFNESFILKRDTQLIEPAWATQIFYIDSVTKKQVSLAFNNKYLSTKENPSRYASFILENSIMTIDGDINEKAGLNLSGSRETDFNFHYGLMYPPSKLYEIGRKTGTAMESSDTDGLSTYKRQEDSLLQLYKTNFKRIISRHPTYFEALSNIYQNADHFEPDELQAFADELDKDLLNLPTGKKLIQFIQQEKKLMVGSSFPDFNYTDTLGGKKTLSDVKGKNGTLILFWASWCKPCREEIPEIKIFYNQYVSKEISIVSISVDNNIIKWEKALLQEQMPWYNLSNLPGDYHKIYSKYNIKGIPLMFLLDRDNKILLANPSSIQEVKDKLKQIGISTS